jgi:hypothetical protein
VIASSELAFWLCLQFSKRARLMSLGTLIFWLETELRRLKLVDAASRSNCPVEARPLAVFFLIRVIHFSSDGFACSN